MRAGRMGPFQEAGLTCIMNNFNFLSRSPEQTQRFGKALGELALAGDVFLLTGNLGAGKTCLTQGIAWGLGVQEYAFSPSFVLVREYKGRLPLYHMDLYRLENRAEIRDLMLDDYFEAGGVCVIEWADKGIEELPVEHLLVALDHIKADERLIHIVPQGERYRVLILSLKDEASTWNWQ